MTTPTPNFQARDHGNGTLEIIAGAPISGPADPVLVAAGQLAGKFRNLILHLTQGAIMAIPTLPRLLDISARARLRIVADTEMLFPFPQCDLPVHATVEAALIAIKGESVVKQVLERLDSIPELNSRAYEILQKLQEPDASFPMLEKLMAGEPSLASQLLKTANSAMFMRRGRAETLTQAMAWLGIDGVKQLLVYNIFQRVAHYWGAQEEVLNHGRACAHLASFLATRDRSDATVLARIRLAGLLHDIGSLALAFFYPKDYQAARALMKSANKTSIEAETATFGVDHPTLGRKLAEAWRFPPILAAVIGDHHALAIKEHERVSMPVFCANGFLNQEVEKVPFTPYYTQLRRYFAATAATASGAEADQTTVHEAKQALAAEYENFKKTPPDL